MSKAHGNRHLPEWRFLLFTMIVTVKAPICNVIRISSTPFRVETMADLFTAIVSFPLSMHEPKR